MDSLFDKNKCIPGYVDHYMQMHERLVACDDIIFAGLNNTNHIMASDNRRNHQWFKTLTADAHLLDGLPDSVYYDWCMDNTGHIWWFGNLLSTDCDIYTEMQVMYIAVKRDERHYLNRRIRTINIPFMVYIDSLVNNYTEDGFDYTKPFQITNFRDVNMGLVHNATYSLCTLVPTRTNIEVYNGVNHVSTIERAMMDLLHRFVETLDSKGFVHVKR